jgi:aspartyl protease family protein
MGEPRGPWQQAPKGGPRRGSGWLLWIAVVGGVAALAFILNSIFPGAANGSDRWMRLLYLVVLLAFISSGLIIGRRRFSRQGLKYAAAWIAISVVLLLGYAYRFELAAVGRNVLGVLVPSLAQQDSAGSLSVRLSQDGHFWIVADVDGVPVRFLVDTGASDVVLSPRDARRLGFSLDELDFSKRYRTANGTVRAAPVRLSHIRVGDLLMKDVAAAVNGAEMSGSLLGMSFLERMRGYTVENDRLILRW